MPKKKIHRRRIVKKTEHKEPLENQEAVEEGNTAEAVPSDPQPAQNNPVQTSSAVNQTPDVGPQAGVMSTSSQNMPQAEPLAESGGTPADNSQVEPTVQNISEERKSDNTVSAEDSPEKEEEENEPIVAKNESGGGRSIFKILLSILKYLFIFALGVAAGGFIVYQKGNIDFLKNVVQKEDASRKTEISPTSAPTEIPVDLTKYSIKVLNGSELEGEASKLKDALETEGFTVTSIGNASESSFLKTVIKAKAETDEAYLEKLKTFLLKTYELEDVEELEESADDDIEIIIGAEPQ